MRLVHFVSLGGCLLAVGCSVYDASLLAGTDEPDAAGSSSTGAGGSGQGGDVGAGGPGGGQNVGGGAAGTDGTGLGSTGLGGAGVASTTSSSNTSSGIGGTGGASSGVGGAAGAPDAGSDGATNDARPVADATPVSDAGCVHEGAMAICLRLSANCGNVTVMDNCGTTVEVVCGTCTGTAVCGALGPNRCGSAVNIVRGGTVFSSSPNVPPEDMTAAFDAKTSTKWFAGNTIATGSIGYDFGAGATHVVSYYTIASANDMPGRDPSAWQFQGSNDGTNWTTLDTRTAQSFAARFQTKSYDCAMRGSYRSYRLNVTANSGSPALQLAEIQLFGY